MIFKGRLRRRFTVQGLRVRDFVERALVVTSTGPPWHRGLVSVVSLVAAIAMGRASGFAQGSVIAPALVFFFTMADVEGPLASRLTTLTWSACMVTIGGLASILCAHSTILFGAFFAPLVFIAGVAAWAGPPFMQATRSGVTAGLLLTNARGISGFEFLELLIGALAIASLARIFESLLAPDARTGDFSTLRQGLFKLRAARPLLWRYALTYTGVAAAAWGLGRFADQVHPTWLTVSTLVVMWPDAARSYERILQRVFGTVAGALVTMGLISVFRDPLVLSTVALSMAFFLPHFIRRNYWLYSGLVVVFVLVALDVSSKTGLTSHIVTERIADVLLGCVFAMVGTLIAFTPVQRRAARTVSGAAK